MFCPNINDKNYQSLASVVGEARAHTIWNMNNGNPVTLNSDGTSSKIYQALEQKYGEKKAIAMRAKMFSDDFIEMNNGNIKTKDSIDANDNVIVNSVIPFSLRTNVNTSPAIQRHRLKSEFIQSGQMMNNVIRNLNRTVPGLKVVSEDHNTVKGTPFSNMRAWVDKNGIHLNTSTLHYSSPVHELTHLWIHVLEHSNKERYGRFMQLVEESIKNNEELFSTIRNKYKHLDDKQLMYEYAATVSGFVSEDTVKRYLQRNNILPGQDKVRTLFARAINVVRELFDGIVQFFNNTFSGSNINRLDFRNASLNDIFLALTQDYIQGNNVLGLSHDEVQPFMDKYYPDNYEAQVENETAKKLISNVSDITSYVINNDDISISGNNQFLNPQYVDRLAENIDSKLNTTRDGNYFYYSFSKRYEFPKEFTKQQRIDKIKTDIIPQYELMVNSFNDNIVEVINRSLADTKKPLKEHIADVFENFKMSEYKIYEIEVALNTLGINEPIVRVLNYKELATDRSLSFLYKPILEGYSPLVIVHGHTDTELDISIVDLASGVLGRQDNILSSYQLNLGSKFGASNKEFTYGNSKADIRRAIISTTLAGMNKLATQNNVKLKVRRLGVIGFQGRNVAPYMIRSIQEGFNNARSLFRLSDVDMLLDQSSNDYAWFKSLIEDDAAWNDKMITQSWRNRLESYYNSYYLELGLSPEVRDSLVKDIGTWEHYDLLNKRKIEIEKKKEKTWIDDPEHKIISQYLLNFKRGMSIYNSQAKDIDPTFLKVTNPHNVKSDIIQAFSIEAEAAKAEFINGVNKYKDEFQRLLELSVKSHGQRLNLIGNFSERIFERLFKTGTVTIERDTKKYKKGQNVEIKLYNQIYGSYNMAEARAAGLTNEDIALADYILKTIRERFIELKIHQNEYHAIKKSREDIEAEVDSILVQGSIPVLPATEDEMVRKGKIGKAISKKANKVARAEYIAGDFILDRGSDVHSIFSSQIDFNQQLINMGLRQAATEHMTNDKKHYVGIDMDKYEDSTMNLEYVFTAFLLDNIRKITIEQKVIPAYNTALQWMHIMKNEYGLSQYNTQDYLEQYYERIVERKNRDPETKLAAASRTAISLYSFISLGFRPTVWMRSTYYNTQNQVIGALASSASNFMTPEEKQLNFPEPADMVKANALMVTEFHKIYALGKKFSIINASEVDVVESIFTTKVDRSPFKQNVAHIGNYYSDMAARLVTMVGFMLHDGSYDAHVFDSQTGELKYDVRKDKRFYKDGKYKSDDAKRIHQDIIEYQKRQNLLDDNGNQIVGYDFEEANTRFKWYVDKYVIGSMDEYQKILLGNTYVGQLFTQFRTYLPDKIFNFAGSRRMSFYGATRKVAMTEDEQVQVIKEQIRNEGSIASLWHLFKDVVDVSRMNGFSFKQLADTVINSDPVTKYNLSVSVQRAIMFVTVMAALKLMMDKGMSDRDRNKLQFLYGNLLLWQEWEDIKAGAMPISGLIDNIMSIVTGEGNWKRMLLRYTGPVNDAIWYYELLTDNNDVMPNQKTRKKIAEMNEKEKKLYYEKRERDRQKRLKDLEEEQG